MLHQRYASSLIRHQQFSIADKCKDAAKGPKKKAATGPKGKAKNTTNAQEAENAETLPDAATVQAENVQKALKRSRTAHGADDVSC